MGHICELAVDPLRNNSINYITFVKAEQNTSSDGPHVGHWVQARLHFSTHVEPCATPYSYIIGSNMGGKGKGKGG
jgi:hypothetical protein